MALSLKYKKFYFFIIGFLVLLIIVLAILNLFRSSEGLFLFKKRSQLSCPVAKEYCKKGKIIKFGIDNQLEGLGFYLSKDSSLYAVSDGLVTQAVIDTGEGDLVRLLTLERDDGSHILYHFKGESDLQAKKVKEGEIVAKVTSEMKAFKDTSLLIVLQQNGELTPLTSRDFRAK